MHRPTPRHTPLLLATLCSLSLFATACGDSSAHDSPGSANAVQGEASPNAPTREGLTVGFLPKQVGTPYFDVADKGGDAAVKKLGSRAKEVGPQRGADTAGQVSYVNALVQDRVDAMAVSALDPSALCTSLKAALDKGVKVVTYDSDTRPECRNVFVSPASAEDIAISQLELLGKQTGYKGDFAILSAARTATNQNAWIRSIKETAKRDPRYGEMNLVDIAYGDDDAQKSYEAAAALLKAHPKLAGIISPTTNGIKAAAEYLSQSKYKGTVRLTGLGAPNDMRPFVKDGTVEAFLLWDPAKLGELAGRAAVALASGQITGREGQMFEAGDMGWFQVGKNGVITLGDPTEFNAKNIDDYDF